MSDKEKFMAVWDFWNVEVFEAQGSVRVGDRRFFFSPDGELEKITFFHNSTRYTATAEGVL